MTRRRLLVPLIFMIGASLGSLLVVVATDSRPTLGLDLQGGFSVVLQAKEVDGKLPSEESVEKAKDIIRQRVDGLGVAEPDITRQGRTVIVQLPGVKNRKKAESLVGNTARLEFCPVLSVAANPNAPTTTNKGDEPRSTTSTTTDSTTSTTAADGSTTAPSSTTTTTGGDGQGENGMGMVGAGEGEGALPTQFAPTTTTIPTTETTVATTTPVDTSTTLPVDASTTTTTTVPDGTDDGPAECGASSINASTSTTTTAAGEAPPAGAVLESADGTALYTLGPVGLNGDALSRATAVLNGGDWQVTVAVKGSQKGVANELFNSCYNAVPECPPVGTDDSGAQRGAVAIVLDGKVLSAPTVNGPDLAADEFVISGGFDEGEAKDLALVLRYGSLPVEFEQAALQQVSASLGADSLRAGLIAGLIGVLALCIYMIIYYRGFGMVVVVSLMVWGALMYSLVSFLSATQGLALTLAGITGVIVSVGTTVDTYVVVFERIKDEIRNGRSVRSATERGYESGIKTVFTANGAAFIGAFLLWYLTVGPVRGFAYFLGISVILDLLVAVAFTRPLLLLLSRSPRFASGRFFGVATATDQVATTKGVPA